MNLFIVIDLLKQFLYIQFNKIGYIGSKYLGLALSKLIKLTNLDLYYLLILIYNK